MMRIGFLVSVAALVLAGAPSALAGRTDTVDPSLMQPPLNPTFAPWECWRAGNRTICEGAKVEVYEAEELDFLDCAAGTVYVTGTYMSVARRTGDAEGLALRTRFRDHYVETWSLSRDGSGPTLRSFGRSEKVFVYATPGDAASRTETISGLEARVTAPGFGVLLIDAGAKSWDGEGNLLKAGGLHAFLDDDEFEAAAARICGAFEGLVG